MSVDLDRRLDRAYPDARVEVPDPRPIWQRGRTARRRRRLVRSVAAVAATLTAVAVVVGLVVVPDTGGDGSGPYITGTETVSLPDAVTADLTDLPTLRRPDGRLLVAALDGAIAFAQSDTTAWVPMSRAAPGDPPYRLVGRGHRLVFYGGDTVYAMDGDVDASPEPIATGPGGAVFVPSDDPQRIWVQAGRTDASARPVREVSIDGTVTVGPVTAPAGNLVGAVASGIVLQHEDRLVVWDPHGEQVMAEFDGPFLMGTSGDMLAWCGRGCGSVELTHLNSGATRTVVTLDGGGSFVGYSGRVSPDGRWLAAVACRSSDACGIVLADLDHGGAQVHGYRTVPPDSDLEWSPDGDRLAVELTDDHGGVLRPGQQLRRTHQPLSQDRHPEVHGLGIVTGRLTW